MEFLFLGTSAGMPSKQRNVTGLAIMEDRGKGWFLVDCGEATQHQLLHTALSAHGLKGIFITHIHGDHCYGLPGLLSSAAMQGRTEPLVIVAPKGVKEWLEATANILELFVPYELNFVQTESFGQLCIGDFTISATVLEHRVPSWAYRFEQKFKGALDTNKLIADGIDRGPVWGQVQQQQCGVIDWNGRRFNAEDYIIQQPSSVAVIGGDNAKPELLAEACINADVLVHEATYTREVSERVGEEYGHSDALRVAEFAERAQLTNLVLTHFSARYALDSNKSPCMQDIWGEAQSAYGGRLFLARDFAHYRLERNGDLVPMD